MPTCECCGAELTRSQVAKKGRYCSLSCGRIAYLHSPAGKASTARAWAKAAETSRRKYYAKVRADIVAICADLLDGQAPSPEMLAVAARMRKTGYELGWRSGYRARQSREMRGAA